MQADSIEVMDAQIAALLTVPVADGEDVEFYLQHGAGGVSKEVDAIMVREVLRTILSALHAVPNERLWCVNVQGPDDVYAMPDMLGALKVANAMNVRFGSLEHHEFDPICRAVVIPWPHSAESHAADLAQASPEMIDAARPKEPA